MRLYLSSYKLGNKPKELLNLLNGRKRTALIENAKDFQSDEERLVSLSEEIENLKSMGLEPNAVDLRDYFGREPALREELIKYDLVWVRGGNCFILRRAFKQSGADNIIKEFLESDSVVYGGYSAGIDMLVPSLHGAELVDDPHLIPARYEPGVVWEGLGLLPYSVAPHYKSDHPESADVDKSIEYMVDNHIPFIALRDGEAIVINGQLQKIVG